MFNPWAWTPYQEWPCAPHPSLSPPIAQYLRPNECICTWIGIKDTHRRIVNILYLGSMRRPGRSSFSSLLNPCAFQGARFHRGDTDIFWRWEWDRFQQISWKKMIWIYHKCRQVWDFNLIWGTRISSSRFVHVRALSVIFYRSHGIVWNLCSISSLSFCWSYYKHLQQYRTQLYWSPASILRQGCLPWFKFSLPSLWASLTSSYSSCHRKVIYQERFQLRRG